MAKNPLNLENVGQPSLNELPGVLKVKVQPTSIVSGDLHALLEVAYDDLHELGDIFCSIVGTPDWANLLEKNLFRYEVKQLVVGRSHQ